MAVTKLIKLAIISAIVLFLLLTALSSLLPSNLRVLRAVSIAAPPATISPLLNNCTRWAQWNEFIQALPVKSVTQNSIRSTQMAITITSSDTLVINTTWRQSNGKTFPGVFSLIRQGPDIIVQWYFDFHFRWYPWEKFSSMVYEKQLGPVMEKSLDNLKQLTAPGAR